MASVVWNYCIATEFPMRQTVTYVLSVLFWETLKILNLTGENAQVNIILIICVFLGRQRKFKTIKKK